MLKSHVLDVENDVPGGNCARSCYFLMDMMMAPLARELGSCVDFNREIFPGELFLDVVWSTCGAQSVQV